MFISNLLKKLSFTSKTSKNSSQVYCSVSNNTFPHTKDLSPQNNFCSPKITSKFCNIKMQNYDKIFSPSSIRFKIRVSAEKELNDNIFVSDNLYDALKKRFQENEDIEINQVKQISQAETEFLQKGIFCDNNLEQIKEKIFKSVIDKKLWINRCKELSTEINISEFESKIPNLLDLYQQIMGSVHNDSLVNILQKVFIINNKPIKGENNNFYIFAFHKAAECKCLIAIFRIECLSNNVWDFYFFKWGNDVVKVDFLGFKIRPFDENK